MLQKVKLAEKRLEDYRGIVPGETMDEIDRLARPLRGLRVLHVNSTARGGGVAELLTSLVPLMRAAGLEAEWRFIYGDREFFKVTKALHNALQGQEVEFSRAMIETFEKFSRHNAEAFEGEWDVVVVHDPQPVSLPLLLDRKGGAVWVWRCHIDLTDPFSQAVDLISPYLPSFDAHIYTHPDFSVDHSGVRRFEFTPCIDPLLPKNLPGDEAWGRRVLRDYGIDEKRPLITQVSRFDPWKDPIGVIEVYRMVKEEIPDVQLALVGSIADDDPQGWEYYELTLRNAGLDFDIHIEHNYEGVQQEQVNAYQSLSDVVVQMSRREGFGLTVTEALWKKSAVVASDTGGISLQIVDGETGYLARGREEFAARVTEMLRDRDKARSMGEAGAEYVRRHFLAPRLLRDYLGLFTELGPSGGAGGTSEVSKG